MRKISLLLLLVSFSAIAGINYVYPTLTVWSDRVDLYANNFSDKNVSCSGTIYMRLASGKTDSIFTSFSVMRRGSVRRQYRPWSYNDPIISANHSIHCY